MNTQIKEGVVSESYQGREMVAHYKTLCMDAIQDVMYGRTLIAVVPEFISILFAQKLVQMLLRVRFVGYNTAPSVQKALGEAFYETTGSFEDVARYFEQASLKNQEMRKLFSPFLHPIDLFRLSLDELWPGGAQLLKNKHFQSMFVGLLRGFESAGEALPHVDHVKLDDVTDILDGRPNAQLAANIHLQGAMGGDIEVYDFKTTPTSAQVLQLSDSYAVDLRKLPQDVKKATYHASAGDLVLFDSTRVHAVTSVTEGKRITASCFLWVDGLRRPLRLFS